MKIIEKVKQDPSILQSMSTPPIEVQRAAIKSDPLSIRYIKNPRPEIQAKAVVGGGMAAYRLISNPSMAAKKAAIHAHPAYVKVIGPQDPDLLEYAIRQMPSVAEELKGLPYWLQSLALNLSGNSKNLILNMPDPHEDLILDHLTKHPQEYSRFKTLPLKVEIDLIDKAPSASHLCSLFRGMKNPSTPCQNYYIRKMLAIAERDKFDLSAHYWWENLTSRIDYIHKLTLINVIDYARQHSYIKFQFKKIAAGASDIETALTLMD